MFVRSFLAAVVAAGLLVGPAQGRPHPRDRDAAYEAAQRGRIMSLRSLESRVVPHFPGASYLGPEFDADSQTYRMKFIRGSRVIWVDVDARSGRIINTSGD